MILEELYNQYKIMPMLRVHLLRVSAVAKQISDNSITPVSANDIVKACLLHDIGNICKFKLGYIPEAVEPEGLKYWQKVQVDFIKKYGDDEHKATELIVEELKLPERIKELVKYIGFSNAEIVNDSNDLEKMICSYSDQRVSPDGVLSLFDRVQQAENRFITNKNIPEEKRVEQINSGKVFLRAFISIEEKIFQQNKITSKDITDQSIKPIIEELKSFDI